MLRKEEIYIPGGYHLQRMLPQTPCQTSLVEIQAHGQVWTQTPGFS